MNTDSFSGLDQYLAVIFPLEYTTRVTSFFSWQLISTVWILGAFAGVSGALQMISAGNMSPWFACRNIVFEISELQQRQDVDTLSNAIPFASTQLEVISRTEYLISTSNLASHEYIPSFILFISYSVRCWLAAISVLCCVLPILILGYMYIRIFLEASKSGRDNRRR